MSIRIINANDGEIIGKNEMYKSKQDMNNGIRSIHENSKGEETKDKGLT